jgi:hypothetical protein
MRNYFGKGKRTLDEHRLLISENENEVLLRLFGLKKERKTHEWRELRNELHNLYSSPNTFHGNKIKVDEMVGPVTLIWTLKFRAKM